MVQRNGYRPANVRTYVLFDTSTGKGRISLSGRTYRNVNFKKVMLSYRFDSSGFEFTSGLERAWGTGTDFFEPRGPNEEAFLAAVVKKIPQVYRDEIAPNLRTVPLGKSMNQFDPGFINGLPEEGVLGYSDPEKELYYYKLLIEPGDWGKQCSSKRVKREHISPVKGQKRRNRASLR